MDNTKVHPGLLLWSGSDVSAAVSWHWVWSPGPALITQLTRLSWRSQDQHVARSRPGHRENRWNVNWAHNIYPIVELLIVQRYPPVDFPALVLLLSSLLLVCEALRFPGDGSPDVTNDYDDAENRIDDDVPDELQMATKIDVRDTQQLRGEIYRLQRLAFVLKWMCGVDLATPGYCKLKFTI